MKTANSPSVSGADKRCSTTRKALKQAKEQDFSVPAALRPVARSSGLRDHTLPRRSGAGSRNNRIPSGGCPLYCLSTRVCHNIERSDVESVKWKIQGRGRGGKEGGEEVEVSEKKKKKQKSIWNGGKWH